jgi:hypothetical protein
MAATAAMAVMAMSSIGNAVAQSSAAKTQGEFARQQADENARLAELQAKETEEAGEKEASQQRAKVRALVGKQKASFAAQGIDIGSGTAADVFGETEEFGEQDAATIRKNAYRQAFGFRQQGQNMRNQGQFDYMAGRAEAKNTLLTGGISAVGYGIQGVGAYSDYKNPKPKVK